MAHLVCCRDTYGVHQHLVKELRAYPKKHQEYLRMSKESFDHILMLVKADITKVDTHMRLALRPELKLALTLNYLSTNQDYGIVILLKQI